MNIIKQKTFFFLSLLVVSTVLLTSCDDDNRIVTYTAERAADDDALEQYVEENNLEDYLTDNGIYFIKTKENPDGPQPIYGRNVQVKYRGTLLNGTEFDAGEIFYPHAVGYVVSGFDLGIDLMRRGEKATIIVPHRLGYDSAESDDIPRCSSLIFEVELIQVQ